jgi:hypothetical protein
VTQPGIIDINQKEESGMAARKAAKKAPAKKAVAKKAVAKKAASRTASRGGLKTGDQYKCSVCGLVVSVDETCGCVETCDIVCCDTPMKKKR